MLHVIKNKKTSINIQKYFNTNDFNYSVYIVMKTNCITPEKTDELSHDL